MITTPTLDVADALRWWLVDTNVMSGISLKPPGAPRLMFTDASTFGWGAHMEDRMAHGVWTEDERCLHINLLEMMAVDHALEAFKKMTAY